jgi:hypothetical protein
MAKINDIFPLSGWLGNVIQGLFPLLLSQSQSADSFLPLPSRRDPLVLEELSGDVADLFELAGNHIIDISIFLHA